MNHFQADWNIVIIGCSLVLAAVACGITYWWLERRRLIREDRMLTARMWPVQEDAEAWLDDIREPEPVPAATAPQIALDETVVFPAAIIPPSDISGPLPVHPMPDELDTSLDAEAFIRQMDLVTSKFLIQNGIPA